MGTNISFLILIMSTTLEMPIQQLAGQETPGCPRDSGSSSLPSRGHGLQPGSLLTRTGALPVWVLPKGTTSLLLFDTLLGLAPRALHTRQALCY